MLACSSDMATKLIYDLDRIRAFSLPLNAVRAKDGQAGIGLERDGRLVAAVLYEDINRFNAWVHLAAVPGRHWGNRAFLMACFTYPFVVCGVRRLSGTVEASNKDAQRLDEHLGFKVEAVLRGAAKDGGDVLIYVMHREECRYVQVPPV